MHKKLLYIIGFAVVLMGIVAFYQKTYSQATLPYSEPATCSEAWTNNMVALQQAWDQQIIKILSQEKPASELVDDSFESLRTYRCWLEYTCRAVYYSYSADPENLSDAGLTDEEIGREPGCLPPQDVGLPGSWEVAFDSIISPFTDQYVYNPPPNKFTFIPQCHSDQVSNRNTAYDRCLEAVDQRLSCDADNPEECYKARAAFLKIEKSLTANAAQKKSRPLEEKLLDMLNRQLVMEAHAKRMKQFLFDIDVLLPCTIKQCT